MPFKFFLTRIMLLLQVILISGLLVSLGQAELSDSLVQKAQCLLDDSNLSNRFDCFPRGVATEDACVARGCCWKPLAENSLEPWCFYPAGYQSYQVDSIKELSDQGLSLVYRNVRKSPYPDDIEYVRVDVAYETESRLRVKIYDDQHDRYESPYPKITKKNQQVSSTKYDVEFSQLKDSDFGFSVVRKSSNRVLFDTRNVGGFTMADQFLQISAKLSSSYLYGIGELRKPFLNDFNWTTLSVFNHDHVPTPGVNLYGSHPFYLAMEEDGKAHGVLLLNSNAFEVLLQPTPAITYRAIGGVLDFYYFLGENPEEVVQEYLELIGRPNLPPYWSLGFQIAKYGWRNLSEVEAVLQRTVEAGIPLDVLYGDIDYMDRYLDFTYDKVNYANLPQFIDTLHSMGIKYIPILDPGIDTDEPNYAPFEEGQKLDIFIKHENGSLFKGKVWNPGHTAFPDFSHPKAYEYWYSLMKRLYSDIKFDGIWIDMNEISNAFDTDIACPDTKWDNPPYLPNIDNPKQDGLKTKTLCMSTKQHIGRNYDVHNLYGITQSEVTNKAVSEILKNKRPFILSRSTFVGSSRYANHWTGDVISDWASLRQSVTDMMLGSIFGMPMIGADICGFLTNTTNELCTRWSQLGAFYPFARNHNAEANFAQDPASPYLDTIVRDVNKKALLQRYSLLPLLYTLLHKANRLGHTVARPLFFEFPNDKATYGLDEQFLCGGALLVAPVLKQGAVEVDVYLPQGTWYAYPRFDKKWVVPVEGLKVTLDAPILEIPVLIRGGHTIVTQTPDVTTTKSRLKDFQITAALDTEGQSQGDLFWDDGDTTDAEAYNFIELKVESGCLNSTVRRFNYNGPMNIDLVKVVGVSQKIQKVKLIVLQTNQDLPFSFDDKTEVLIVETKASEVTFETDFEICWSA